MAIRGFMRNRFYGNPNQRDFTEADLPQNRFQLFCHVLSLRWGKMVWMNLLYLLVWLPVIAWTILNVLQLDNILSLPPEAFSASFQQILYIWLLILFPLIAITGPFNAAMSDVFRYWAWDEHCYPLTAF